MFKLFVIAALSAVAYVNANANGYAAPKMAAGGYGYGYTPIPLAVKSMHDIKYYDVPTKRVLKPIYIEIGAQAIPVSMLFKSASSALTVKQQHQGAAGSQQESKSEDEPHYLKHTVKKPIYQEIVEVITPMRKIVQQVQPVQEQVQTLVYRDAAGYGYAAPQPAAYMPKPAYPEMPKPAYPEMPKAAYPPPMPKAAYPTKY